MVDFHTHCFPDEFIKERKKLAERDENFSVIYSHEKARMASSKDLLEYVESYSLKAVTFGFTWLSNHLNMEHNRFIMDLARKNRRIIPFAVVNIFEDGWEKVVETCISDGFAGFGEISYYLGRGVLLKKEWDPFMEILRGEKKPLLLHVNESVGHTYPGKADIKLEEIYAFVRRFPGNTIILAHMGGGIFFYELMRKVKEEFKNVYYDTAAAPFLFGSKVYPVFETICGRDKLLFGTDYPLLKPDRYLREMREFMDEDFIRAVSWKNPGKILGMEC